MRVIRAHDGVAFEFTNQHLDHIDRLSALLDILGQAMDLDATNLILMNPLGSQLTDNLLRSILDAHRSPSASLAIPTPSSSKALSPLPPHSSTTQDPTHLLYAFDRQYLSADPAEVLSKLASQLEDALEPSVPRFDPDVDTNTDSITTLARAHHKSGSAHLRTTILLLSHVRAQKSALEAALNNLDKFRESPKGAWEAFETFAQPLVEGYGTLLEAYAPALALARRVKIHPQLLSTSALNRPSAPGSTIGSSGSAVVKSKFMGDYVMEDRITQIRDRCLKVYDELCLGFKRIRASSREVDDGAITLRSELAGPDCDLEDLDLLEKDAEEGFQRIEEVIFQIPQLTEEEQDALLESFMELFILDDDSRERIAFLVERKNFWLHHIVTSLNRISVLQGILSSISSDVQVLNTELRTRTDSFKHLARLKDFVTAYASTVVEVVRRREFARHLLDYASALANSLSKLTADERKRRITYRSDYGGKMPFNVEGLDDINVPTIEFEIRNVSAGALGGSKPKDPSRSIQAPGDLPQLTRADVDDLIVSLRNIEESSEDERDPERTLARGPAREVRLLIEKQFSRLESMENAFAQAVERIVVTESQVVMPSPPVDQELLTQLQTQVAELQTDNDTLREQTEQDKVSFEKSIRKFQSDTKLHLQKIEDLKLQLLQVKDEFRDERDRLLHDQNTFAQERDDLLTETRKLRAEVGKLDEDLKTRSKALQDVERQLASARATADDATKELHELEARHRDQLSDHSVVLNQLQQYRERSADVEAQLRQVLSDNKDKDQVFETHKSDAERVRLEMQAEIEQLKSDLAQEKDLNRDATAKINQHELRIEELGHENKVQADNLAIAHQKSTKDAERAITRLETHCRTAVEMVQTYQLSSRQIMHRIDSMPRPGSSSKSPTAPLGGLAQSSMSPQDGEGSLVAAEPITNKPLIPAPSSSEFDQFLEALLQHNPETLAQLVQSKLENLSLHVRKWMKESKAYRERATRAQELAHFRITFRDFAKGDLALFLPTRNPTAQVWAAFNVSFPHYFLQANEVVAPIIKSREWLVARIITLTEKMVDPKEPDANPYALPAGTRYFLLEVEPWSVEKNSRRAAQSVIGLAPSPVKKHSFSRSATLPSQMALQMSSPINKRHSAGEASSTSERHQPSPPQSESALANPQVDVTLAIPAPSQPESTHAPSDLTQSEFTVIDSPPSPAANDLAADSPFASPFRTTPGCSSTRRIGPSALALSLAKSYQKSPLSHVSGTAQPDLVPLPEVGSEENASDGLQPPAEFKPSESARPAFLASLSETSSQSRRTNLSSTMPPPVRPRLRPVPKAHTASRSNSRASSIASSSNINPAMKKLLKPGSPSSKSLSTVSTTLVLSEKNPASKENENLVERSSPPAVGPRSIVTPTDLAKRRLSLSGSNYPGMTHGTSSSSLSNSSMGGSGHCINPRTEGQLSRSPSFNATAAIGVAPNGMNAGGSNGVGLSTSLFGTWRKRKESLVLPGSFGGASDLLKRFSSQSASSPKS